MSDSDDITHTDDPDLLARRTRVRKAAGAGVRPSGGSPEYAQLDDPAFLDERARLRERLMHEPENAIGRPELERVYAAMTEEFLRRAHIAWTTSM